MSNHAQHVTNVVEVDEPAAYDALRAMLHTIVFQRALGEMAPGELKLESFSGLSVATCGDPRVHEAIEEAVEEFFHHLQVIGPNLVRGEIVVSFYETRKRPGLFGLSAAKEEKVYWERWVVPIIINKGASQMSNASEVGIRNNLLRILLLASEVTHVPQIKSDPDSPPVFRFEISVSQGNSAGKSESLIGKLLSNGPSLRFNV
mmetsp:Transcript_5435/g.10223  ORF Transcript_5435/g.10223 Transcript_5435/m.10223 type:complete len:203 (-) Transcript_5435:815-1423(-)